MKAWLRVLWVLSLGVFLALVVAYGAGDIASAVAGVGWRLGIVCLLSLIPLALHTAGWAALLPRHVARPFAQLLAFRWYGESVANLLPVLQVGGDILRGHLHQRTGVSGPLAIGVIVVDLTTEVAGQLGFAALALAVLLSRQGAEGTAVPITVALALLGAMVFGFYFTQRRGLFGRVVHVFERMVGVGAPAGSAYAEALDRAVRRLYRRRRQLRLAFMFHLFAWLAGALQVYAAAGFLGYPIGWLDALMLEGLIVAVRAGAFMIPAALGVQEGGYILLGAMIGLPPEAALSLSLIRRVRELLLGVPGILVWQRATLFRSAAALARRRSAR